MSQYDEYEGGEQGTTDDDDFRCVCLSERGRKEY
jgi:hypothetical protein